MSLSFIFFIYKMKIVKNYLAALLGRLKQMTCIYFNDTIYHHTGFSTSSTALKVYYYFDYVYSNFSAPNRRIFPQ
jgi:hypothetical protein